MKPLFTFVFLFFYCIISAQKHSRWALGFELGTGFSSYSYAYNEQNGYYQAALIPEYRLSREFSIEGGLKYMTLQTDLSGRSVNAVLFDGSRDIHGLAATFGPRVNIRSRYEQREFVLVAKAGILTHFIRHDLQVVEWRQTRQYKPFTQPFVELGGRWAFWVSERTGLEIGVGYSRSYITSGALELRKASVPDLGNTPFYADQFMEFLSSNEDGKGYWESLVATLGFRFKLF